MSFGIKRNSSPGQCFENFYENLFCEPSYCQNNQKIWIWADLHQYDCDHYGSLDCGPILQYSRVISFDRSWCGPMLGGVSLRTI